MGVHVYGETRAHFISGIFRMAFFWGGEGGATRGKEIIDCTK